MHFTHCVGVTLPNNGGKLTDFHEMQLKFLATKEKEMDSIKPLLKANSVGAGNETCAGPCNGHLIHYQKLYILLNKENKLPGNVSNNTFIVVCWSKGEHESIQHVQCIQIQSSHTGPRIHE